MPIIAWWIIGLVAAGGTGAVVLDQYGDAAEQTGEAAEKGQGLAQWIVLGGALFLLYRAMSARGFK